MVTITRLSPADAIAEIAASSSGPEVGAFFDLDGTLVDGFTAAVHVGDRIRRRQAGIRELLGVFEAALRYRFGRLEFEHLIMRAAGYLRGESLADLDELGERLSSGASATRAYRSDELIGAVHPGTTRRPLSGYFRRAVQSVRTRRARVPDRRNRQTHCVGGDEG
jgi:hypothetical protein